MREWRPPVAAHSQPMASSSSSLTFLIPPLKTSQKESNTHTVVSPTATSPWHQNGHGLCQCRCSCMDHVAGGRGGAWGAVLHLRMGCPAGTKGSYTYSAASAARLPPFPPPQTILTPLNSWLQQDPHAALPQSGPAPSELRPACRSAPAAGRLQSHLSTRHRLSPLPGRDTPAPGAKPLATFCSLLTGRPPSRGSLVLPPPPQARFVSGLFSLRGA